MMRRMAREGKKANRDHLLGSDMGAESGTPAPETGSGAEPASTGCAPDGARIPDGDTERHIANVWERVRLRLKNELGENVYSSWFSHVDLEACESGSVRLSVPTRFLKSWIQSHYRDRVLALWCELMPEVRVVNITVRSPLRTNRMTVAGQDRGDKGAKPVRRAANAAATSGNDRLSGSPLDPRLTFDTFMVGRSNKLAEAAARQVATAPAGEAVAFNPLYLHASVGLGKSHLLQAIAAMASAGASSRRVLYLTVERFMSGFVAAFRNKSALDFKNALRNIDLLLIDDMQFLYGQSIQREFCHLLNALIDGDRQVVIACDRPPSELETLEERVRSRLSGGLTVEIGPMETELRRKILEGRAEMARMRYPGLVIPEAVLDHVAQVIETNGRDLEGAFNRLVAHNQLSGAPITLEMVDRTIRDLVRTREPRRIKIEDIQKAVAKHFNVTKADLLSSRRTRSVVRPRQIAMYLSKLLTPRSLPEIGRRFGGRDHTTVLHAVRKIEGLIDSDSALADDVAFLKQVIDDHDESFF